MGMDICSLEKEMGDISTTVLAISLQSDVNMDRFGKAKIM
jgi:hypothetical protein